MSGVKFNRAITVRNPWAWAILHGGKNVENRSWTTDYRGPIYIHAGLADPAESDLRNPAVARVAEQLGAAGLPVVFKPGYILGTVELTGVHHASDCRHPGSGLFCSEWAFAGNYHWVLSNPRPLTCPFPETGKQGLWSF